MNPFAEVNWNPGVKEKRRFALTLMIGFPCLAAALLVLSRLQGEAWNAYPFVCLGGAGLAVGLILYAVPGIARPFYLVWYFVGCCIGIVVGNLVLSAFFFLIIAPLGLLMRLCGRRPVNKGFDKNAKTYWRDAEKVSDVKRYYRQF